MAPSFEDECILTMGRSGFTDIKDPISILKKTKEFRVAITCWSFHCFEDFLGDSAQDQAESGGFPPLDINVECLTEPLALKQCENVNRT